MKTKLAALGWAVSLGFAFWFFRPIFEPTIRRAICNQWNHAEADFTQLPDGFTRMTCRRCGDSIDIRAQFISIADLLDANSLFDVPMERPADKALLN